MRAGRDRPDDALSALEQAAENAGGNPPPEVIFGDLFGHLMPVQKASFDLFGMTWNITNHTIIMALAAALVLLFFWAGHTARNLRDGGVPRGRMPNLIESLVLFIRDQLIYDTMGKKNGRKFAPLFLTQFFFIWFVNVLGNLPIPLISGAPTANLAVTSALATTTFVVMIACALKASGPIGMWTDLLPKGLPPIIREILFVVEVLGFFIKPIALTIRLFANIFGGHLVVLSLFGMIYMFESWVIAGAILPMSIFVGVLELLVAFLQAFIFTFLSIMFVQMAVHPEH